ncbi:MAG: tetratricopeptide repeat protein [Candidatus Eremiobacterota bacterium]
MRGNRLLDVLLVLVCGAVLAGWWGWRRTPAEPAVTSTPAPAALRGSQERWQRLYDGAWQAFARPDVAEAERLLLDSLAEAERIGLDSSALDGSLTGLSTFYYNQQREEEADRIVADYLERREVQLGAEHPAVAELLMLQGARLLGNRRDYPAAERVYRRALAIRETSLGPGHPKVGEALVNLSETLALSGRYEESVPLFERAIALYDANPRLDDSFIALLYRNRAALLERCGRAREAAAMLETAGATTRTRGLATPE